MEIATVFVGTQVHCWYVNRLFRPDTGSFLQKVEEEKQKKEGEDNRSFFQKYVSERCSSHDECFVVFNCSSKSLLFFRNTLHGYCFVMVP